MVRTRPRRIVFPVVLGAGRRLFVDAADSTSFRLTETRTLGDSLALLTDEVTNR